MKRRRYEDDWENQLEAELNYEDYNRLIYPEETELSPRARMPEEISGRQNEFNVAQKEIEGHLFIPYYHLPPKYARFVDATDSRSLAAGATATVIAETTIDLNYAVLRWFGNELTDSAGYTNVEWTINVNGVAFGPWRGINLSLGAINFPSLIFIPLTLSDTFNVVATNNGSAAYTVRTRIKGWKW